MVLNCVAAPIITATNRDSGWPNFPGSAATGDTVSYSVVITNTGDADATGVVFNDTIDAATSTLVGGSAVIDVRANADTYSSIGNVGINSNSIVGAGQHVTDNDTLNGATLTGFGNSVGTANGTVPNGSNTVTTTNSGTVKLNADASFTYNPAAGFTGADTFFYALTKGSNVTAARVTINVSTPIWFVNASAAGGGDGTLATPFNCLTGAGCFSAVNDGGAGHPAAGHLIFLYRSAGAPAALTGGLSLLNNQKLIGEGASASLATIAGVALPPGSNALPATGNAPPVITAAAAATNGVNLAAAASATLRGFTVGNTTGFKLASGATFGTLTVSEITLNGTGGTLNLTSGALAATFISITSTGSAATQGLILGGCTGSMTVTGGTSITNPTSQGILVGTTTANIDFGNTTISGGTDGVSLQNNSAGTRTFGTLSISSGSGRGFLHAVGGGLATAGTTTITNPAGIGIDIQSSTTLVTFGATTVNKGASAGTGVNLGGVGTGNTGGVTFASLDITASNGAGLVGAENSGAITVTSGTGNISATNAPAINITKPSTSTPLAMAFANVSSNSSTTQGINLLRVSGTLTTSGGTLTGAANSTFKVDSSTANITYGGSITQATAGQRVVDIQNNTSGTSALSGAVTSSGGTGTGVLLNSNTGATINFSGGINLVTNANAAFTATAGGTVSATQNNTSIVNTLNTTTGTALNVANTTIGASGLNFRSISSNGAANGIKLDTTGASGGLTVTGNSSGICGGQVVVNAPGTPATVTLANSADCTGGRIQNTVGGDGGISGVGVYLNNTRNVSLTRMQIDNHPNFAILGTDVIGFALASSLVNGVNGTNTSPVTYGGVVISGEASVAFGNLTGSGSAITNSTISGSINDNVTITNTTSTPLNFLTISGSQIRDNAFGGNDGVVVIPQVSSNMTVKISNNFFAANRGDHMDMQTTTTTSTGTLVFTGNTLQGGHPNALGQGMTVGGIGNFTYNISSNTIRDSIGVAINATMLTAVPASSTQTMSGTINGNFIGVPGVANSGSAQGDDIVVELNSIGTHNATVSNNNVRQNNNGHQITLTKRNDTGGVPNGTLNVTISGNTVKEPGGGGGAGILVNSGTATNDAGTVCVDIGGAGALANDLVGGGKNLFGADEDFRVRQRFATTVRLPGYGGAATDAAAVVAFIQGRNTGVETGSATVQSPPGGGFVGGAACTAGALPTLPSPGDGTALKRLQDGLDAEPSATASAQTTQLADVTATAPGSQAADDAVAAATVATSQAVVAPSGPTVARANAAGSNNGFMLATRLNQSASMPTVATVYYKDMAARGGTANRTTLTQAQAQTQAQTQAQLKSPATAVGREIRKSGGTVSVSLGTLTAGSSASVTFQVIINDCQPAPHLNISNQGSVSGSNFATVSTDDPDTGAANDATLTTLTQTPTTVTQVVPNSGPTSGGTVVTITGTNFSSNPSCLSGVTVGGNAATSVTVTNSTSITATTPAGAAGPASVLVSGVFGSNAANTLFTYSSSPTVTAINPSSGPTAGGQPVTLTGTNFNGATGVTIGGTAATSVVVVNANSITATTPAGAAGTASVVVTTPSGSNPANTLYTYAAAPVITLNPANAPDPAGAIATYTAAATGSPTPTVQWQRSSDGGTFTNVAGATSTTLTITTATTPNIYQYRAVFTNSQGVATTTATRLPRRR